ncbi:RNA N6-adenosine-methyltransferase mettl16-like isoform X2 [Hydractinia symbiolongicarpus]|uniref:RNA N6-adenosine-methyltransferase mettl16-like isoform X2 n=1 Tax=Hydractinia symbiolongicarpus TaxID=13093 RepID=UPI00254F974A|nr:RNA N6-adenosine-methyltransferase mettl16-like isoform X2 [Hydractinia symbiolongicarpus]
MHPRNIFKNTVPNFEELAKEFPEFTPYLERGASGKAYVNFKDPASLRALSLVLLKKYFQIIITIPLDRLIPTIPLRLNYIHWIEDLVEYERNENKKIFGFDIGCGASCVYPLLCSKMNHWKFLATEIDDLSAECAVKNVKSNLAEDDVIVIKTSKDDPMFTLVLEKSPFPHIDFTMCNPPFFEEIYDEQKQKDRTNHRPPPAGISTASDSESFTSGGEVYFVSRMIDESMTVKEKIRWYTTMLGRKSSLKQLLKYLKGHNVPAKEKKEKKAKPFYMSLSDTFFKEHDISIVTGSMSSKERALILWDVVKVFSKKISALKLSFEDPEHVLLMNNDAYEITGSAYENTWTRQRQKKREDKRKNAYVQENKPVSDAVENVTDPDTIPEKTVHLPCKRTMENDGEPNAKKPRLSGDGTDIMSLAYSKNDEKLFDFSITVATSEQFCFGEKNRVIVTFLCLSGNREQFHQLFLYFKNCVYGVQVNIK